MRWLLNVSNQICKTVIQKKNIPNHINSKVLNPIYDQQKVIKLIDFYGVTNNVSG